MAKGSGRRNLQEVPPIPMDFMWAEANWWMTVDDSRGEEGPNEAHEAYFGTGKRCRQRQRSVGSQTISFGRGRVLSQHDEPGIICLPINSVSIQW